MSADECKVLFVLDNGNDIDNKEDPVIIQVRENLVVAERLQQEWDEL